MLCFLYKVYFVFLFILNFVFKLRYYFYIFIYIFRLKNVWCLLFFFLLSIISINSMTCAYSWLKEAGACDLPCALNLTQWKCSIPCDVPTLYYISLFSLLGVQEIPTYRPEKETLQTWISSIALDLSSALETREERRNDRRWSRDQNLFNRNS